MQEDPKDIVARQLHAYNARDIEAFMAEWAEEAEYFAHPATLLARGKTEIRARHIERFREPDLHGTLLGRVGVADMVVDHEVVTRNFPTGRGKVRVIAIYQIVNGRIARAWFKQGEPVIETG